jgi:hypothetical protein
MDPFGNDPQPWTDRNSPPVGGSGSTGPGATPLSQGTTPPAPGQVVNYGAGLVGPQRQIEGNPISSTGGGGATPADNEPAGRSPHIVGRIPDQPASARHGYMPIPAQNPSPAHFTPVGSGMDLSGQDLDNVTRTILGEVGQNATPASMASIASVIRNRLAAGGYGSSTSWATISRQSTA